MLSNAIIPRLYSLSCWLDRQLQSRAIAIALWYLPSSFNTSYTPRILLEIKKIKSLIIWHLRVTWHNRTCLLTDVLSSVLEVAVVFKTRNIRCIWRIYQNLDGCIRAERGSKTRLYHADSRYVFCGFAPISKNAVSICTSRFHLSSAIYFLLPRKIPEEIRRRSMLFHNLRQYLPLLTLCRYNLLPQ